jgi:pre-mRNA 3'-end-processing factor FIP1
MASDHEDEDDDLYGSSDPKTEQSKNVKDEEDASSGDEPMDEGADSGDDDDDDDEDSESGGCVCACPWSS